MKKIFLGFVGCMSLLLSCQRDFQSPQPENNTEKFSEDRVFDKAQPDADKTTIRQNGKYTFVVKTAQTATADEDVDLASATVLNKIVSDYNKFKSAQDYVLLPETNYSFIGSALKKGTDAAEVSIEIKEYNTLPQGDYLLPLNLQVAGKTLNYLVFVRKDAAFVPLSAANPKPMPPGAYTCPDRTQPVKMVAYVETNDWDIRNMGQFLLKDSRKPIFDIVILFAANMNYDLKSGKRVLFFNDKLEPVLKDPEKYIKPLQDRGIKVLIDILPNHQGVGFENFQSYEDAVEFAKECKIYTDKLGIDGWDIDEEYANYPALPQKPRVGVQSYFWFMRAMKTVMPDKLLTLYDYAHPLRPASVDENGKTTSDYLDYSWANYNENHGSYAGLPNNRYGKLSVQAATSFSRTQSNTLNNVRDCFGLMMFFNIRGTDIRSGLATTRLSTATNLLYGESCEFVGKYHYGPGGN